MVNMELSILSEDMSNSMVFEDESVDDDVGENSTSEFADEAVVLQLTVEDDPDPVYNGSPVISHVAKDSVVTKSNICLTGCSMNMSSSLLEKNSSGRRMSRRTVSAAAAAQAKVFRKYLLDGDIQARISELDSSSGLRVCVHASVCNFNLHYMIDHKIDNLDALNILIN